MRDHAKKKKKKDYKYIIQVLQPKKNPLKFIIFENYLVVLIQLYLRRAIEL